METTTRLAQEGTFVSDRDTGVTLEVHNAPQCTAVFNHGATSQRMLARVGDKWSVRVVMGADRGLRGGSSVSRSMSSAARKLRREC